MSSLLTSRSEEELRSLRTELFSSAKLTGLVHPGDTLVRRLKRAVGPSLVVKYATDIAELCYALKHQQPVSRTLLKNGKRSATTFLASRLRNSSITSASNTTASPTSSSTQQLYLKGLAPLTQLAVSLQSPIPSLRPAMQLPPNQMR